jgi:hypothetical protein
MYACFNYLKSGLKFFTVLALLFLFENSAKASHVMGGDISWECIGPNQYRISLTVYRDCNGIQYSLTSQTITYRACGAAAVSVSLTRVAGYPIDITPLCSTEPSRCNTTAGTFGVQAILYQGVVTLPAGCNSIIFNYTLAARNAAITTIANPGGTDISISATLNNTINPCDNSPRFLNAPTAYLCRNQQTFYNHGGFDPDGDSLRYSLVSCMQSSTANVTYNAGFSATAPLTT